MAPPHLALLSAEEQDEEQEEEQEHNRHGGGGGFVPKPAKSSDVGKSQQYLATKSAKKQQKTRDLKITSTLLHPEHSMALGVWTSKGHVKACSKGIGIDIKLRDQRSWGSLPSSNSSTSMISRDFWRSG
jgi:hypothetical protein